MTTLARAYRDSLAAILEHSRPEAPTLCEGWNCADLAEHLYVRENDPLAAPGLLIPALAGLTQDRMSRAMDSLGYLGLVDAFSHGPKPWSPMRIPAVDRLANGVEYFVHHEDVRRAQPGWSPDVLPGEELSNELWQQLAIVAKRLSRACPSGLRLERSDVASARPIVVKPGDVIVTARGHAAELTLWVYGRAARVEFIGDPPAVEAVEKMSRAL
ncbi:TIGR03085 family protein [Propionibacterium cyclohexanicum]|uniref:TIGR03085 family protein n=1 Tax=Propionibacterium cyclohexanicum TaxID=64702 RepID=A0A1H9Q5J2_9ACTN|nr:TIGR03085 family metal-binding protein [Propionibacterium cyclohexanicum]SER55395.1 TIGR03085 family protein [Propionibacterium cyclohexanicum]